MVFTQHPGYLPLAPGEPIPPDWNWQREDEPGPGYWTGEASQPRAAQHENVAIAIYAPQYPSTPGLGFGYRNETHAYFPHAHLDEVVQVGSWTFGRKDDAYVALYSWRETEWRGGQPDVFENADLWLNGEIEYLPLFGLVGRARSDGEPRPPRSLAGAGFEDLEHVCDAAQLERWAASAPRNTDDHPIIEFRAAASHFRRSPAETQRLARFLLELCSGAGQAR